MVVNLVLKLRMFYFVIYVTFFKAFFTQLLPKYATYKNNCLVALACGTARSRGSRL